MKDSKFELRLCVLVTVSGFQVFLGKCTRKADNQNKNSSVHFWQSVWKSKVFRWSTFVENSGIFLTIFRGIFDQLGQIGSFLRSKMSKIIPEFSTNVKNLENNCQFLTFLTIFKIFGIMTVHFRHELSIFENFGIILQNFIPGK